MQPIASLFVTFSIFFMIQNIVQPAMYDISMDSLEPNPNSDKSFINNGTLRVSKKSRNLFVVAGYFEYLQNVDDNTKVNYAIYYNDNKKPMIAGEQGYCKVLDNDSGVLRRLREVSNMPPPGTCPFPKGRITINNYELDDSQLPMTLPPGQYTLVMKMIASNELKAGYRIKLTVK